MHLYYISKPPRRHPAQNDIRAMKKLLVLLHGFLAVVSTQPITSPMNSIASCFSKENPVICLKEEALNVLDRGINSTRSIPVYDLFEIVKDPEYKPKVIDESLPDNVTLRNGRLNEILWEKLDELVNSRTVKLDVEAVSEGMAKIVGRH